MMPWTTINENYILIHCYKLIWGIKQSLIKLPPAYFSKCQMQHRHHGASPAHYLHLRHQKRHFMTYTFLNRRAMFLWKPKSTFTHHVMCASPVPIDIEKSSPNLMCSVEWSSLTKFVNIFPNVQCMEFCTRLKMTEGDFTVQQTSYFRDQDWEKSHRSRLMQYG